MDALEFIKSGILGYGEKYFENIWSEPAYFVDLNLDQIIKCVLDERKGYHFQHYFYRLPDCAEMAEERQKVLCALEEEELFDGFLKFSDFMEAARNYAYRYERAEFEWQRRRFLMDCGEAYVKGVELLAELFGIARKSASPSVKSDAAQEACNGYMGKISSSKLLCGLKAALEQYIAKPEYQSLRESTKKLADGFGKLRVQVAIVRDKVKITLEEAEEDSQSAYYEKLKRLFPEQAGREEFLENPFLAATAPGVFETLMIEVFRKNNPTLFDALKDYENNFSKEVADLKNFSKEDANLGAKNQEGKEEEYKNGRTENFMADWLLVLEQQLQVFLAFRLFMKRMSVTGYPFTYPVLMEERKTELCLDSGRQSRILDITDAYDLALLIKSMYSHERVVCNDAWYSPGEAFLVVTGPNQGGKTTFARSIGQIVYFSMMGLAAPCRSVALPFFDGILTHFSVEESLETGRGKLKEELVRLEPMMHQKEKNKFVIINELFTTAATYDACIMGKRVMEHFMGRECIGIYVTHLQELADEEKIADGTHRVVSLSACVDEADSHIRTYKIVRKPAEGIGYAFGIVEKYHLTYKDLKERLRERMPGAEVSERKETSRGQGTVEGKEISRGQGTSERQEAAERRAE